jgi:very-short-patch-repair endonuclease
MPRHACGPRSAIAACWGCKFRRQFPVGPYLADFACLSHRLVVELDGGQQAASAQEDAARSDFLACQGYLTLRFWNNTV